jgi:LuxR family maltose regulon positive regulatory protein
MPHDPFTEASDPLPARTIEPVPSTKLLPPRAARRLMPREALLARLMEARRQRCVVVQGPAGSGKTSTLVAWRQALLTLDFDVAWLSLAAEDNEPTRLFGCLLASIGAVDARAVHEATLLMGRDSDEAALEHGVITVVEAVSARSREFVLMLDDVQHLEDRRIHQALQWLLDYAPPNLHLVFGSRSALPVSLARLRAQRLLSEFDLRDLRFSAEESERFLREQLGRIDRRDAQVLHELTDGWVAGLQLFAVDLRAKQGGGFARVQVRDADAFALYFEREVLVNVAPDDLDLLTRVSACSRFCASLCATLLGQPNAVASLTSRLSRLDGANLFISQVNAPDHESWYRLHPLLREILLARLARLSEAERRALHRASWRWFEARGHIDEAVRHAVQAGDAQAAADIVEACAVDMMGRGELAPLADLMRQLPPEQVGSRFALRMVSGYLFMYAHNLDAVEVALRELEAELPSRDAAERFAVRLLRAALALRRDDTDALRSLQPELQELPEDAGDFAFAGRAHLLSWLYMHEDQHDAARTVLAEGARHGMASARRFVGQALEGMSLALEGRVLDAERVLQDVLQACEARGAALVDVAGLVAGLLGESLYELNELEPACRLLEPRIDVLERTSLPDAALRALLVLVRASWLLGRRLEALDHLERLEDYATRNGLDRVLAHALSLRLRLHLADGEATQAAAVRDRLADLAGRHSGASRGTAAETYRVAERARAEACLQWRDFGGAVACLTPLLERTITAGRGAETAAVHVALAAAHAGYGTQDAAREHVVQALRLGHRLGLVRSLLDASQQLPAMLEATIGDKVLDPVLTFYAKRLLAAQASPRQAIEARPGAGAAPGAQLLNERERQVLALVAQALPNKKIARVLGVTPHTVKWHLGKAYAKLGVSERDEAVARMRDLEMKAGDARP